jgi:hypothetical protein
MRTKWDILQERLEEAKLVVQRLEDEIKYLENTPFVVNGTGECSGCREVLATEKDFAKHFLIPDERFLNLGNCPNV